MMPGMTLEFSLIQATTSLLLILGGLVIVSLIMGVVTLPIFYSSLLYKVGWFWASEERTARTKMTPIYLAVRFGFPLMSFAASAFCMCYFGLFDLFEKRPLGKKGSVEEAFQTKYDQITRSMLEKVVSRYPDGTTIDWSKHPVTARSVLTLDETCNPELIDGLSVAPISKKETPEETAERNRQYAEAVKQAKDRDQIIKDLLAIKPEDRSAEQLPPNEKFTKQELRRLDGMVVAIIEAKQSAQTSIIQLFRGGFVFFMLILGPFPTVIFVSAMIFGKRGFTMVLRSLGRNITRTSLTYLAIFVLVAVVTAVWTVLDFLDKVTQEKESNLKGIVTEKYQIPSQMKPSHLGGVKRILEEMPDGQRPDNIDDNLMTWAFVGGTLDPDKRTANNSLFFFCTEPEKVLKMMPGLEDLTVEQMKLLEDACKLIEQNPRAVIIGHAKLVQMNKQVGDRIKVTSLNYKDIVFDCEIVAEFPAGTRWDQSAAMNRKYLDNALSEYEGKNGKAHPLADKCMNLIWVRLPNKQAFEEFSERITGSGQFTPPVKVEIESSAYANFLSPLQGLLMFMRYVLAPGLLGVTTLVISLVISIGVRERRTEMAVLKVLGFRPWMVMGLVLGESMLMGSLSGFLSTATMYSLVNAAGGLSLPIAIFGKFFIPTAALWWGPMIGILTSLIGTILPAWSARKIKVSEVFSRVA